MTYEEMQKLRDIRDRNSKSCDCKSCINSEESAPGVVRCNISARIVCADVEYHQFYIPRPNGKTCFNSQTAESESADGQALHTSSPKCRCSCQQSPVINGQIVLAVDDSCPCHGAALRAGA